jgi:general secretion pathway protein D
MSLSIRKLHGTYQYPFLRFSAALLLIAMLAAAQQPPLPTPAAPAAQPPAQQPATPAPVPATPAPVTPAPVTPAQVAPPAAAKPDPAVIPAGTLNLQNASLTEVIDILARQLKLNYIIDPRVKGSVTINTYGETKTLNARNLLDMILRINNFAMIQVGDIYRIVPAGEVKSLPLKPEMNPKNIAEDDQTMLNMVFLKYATVADLLPLIKEFQGEGSTIVSYPPANLLLIQDSRRSMRRLMDLINQFDSEAFTGQRVKLFQVTEGRPSDIAKELDQIFKSISLSEKNAPIKFLPIDRINTIIAIAPNPGAFEEVERWLKKLDVPIQITAGSIDNYVYRVKYGRAESLAGAIMALYGGVGFGYGGGGGGFGYGGGMGGMGGPGIYPGSYGAPGTYNPYTAPGAYGAGVGAYPGASTGAYPGAYAAPGGFGAGSPAIVSQTGVTGAGNLPAAGVDQSGAYLGAGGASAGTGRIPHIVPNPLDNSLLIQGTPQEYAGIIKLLRDLDVPPRQVLIEAKIYEVDLSGAYASGVAAFLQKLNSSQKGAVTIDTHSLTGSLAQGSLNLSAGALVGQSRELLAFLSAQESSTRAKVISAPSIIATDSIPASITVGDEVPTLSSQAVTNVQSGGSSLFANNVTNRNTGVTLNILARVNPSGIVTLVINQEVTAPEATTSSTIDSPSFSKRAVQTQVTVQDGDTIAIGGIINETSTHGSSGIPFLHRIPILGIAFGSQTYSKQRTELIVFMTPRVIYDNTDMVDASEDLKSRLKKLKRDVGRQQ